MQQNPTSEPLTGGSRRSAIRLLTAMLIGCIVLPLALFAGVAWNAWRDAHANVDERIGRAVDVLHEHSLEVLKAAELMASTVVASTAGMSDAEIASQAPRLRALLSEMTSSFGERNTIWIIDRNGRVLVTDFKSADASTSVADRDYFQEQVARDRGSYIGALSLPRLPNGQPFFSLSRRRPPQSEFTGVVAVSLAPSVLGRFFQELGDFGDYFALIRDDGAFLARYPALERPVNATAVGPPQVLQQNPLRGIYTSTSTLDSRERRVAYRKLDGYPVFVLAGIETAVTRAQWLTRIGGWLLFGLPATALLIVLLLVAMSRTRRLYEEEARREVVEAGLRHMQGLETLGQLTGGVAHDFNNLLMVVLGTVEKLRRTLPGDERLARGLEAIQRAAERGERLTNQLLSFARRRVLAPQPVDVARRIPELREMLTQSLRGDISISLTMPDRAAIATVDPSEFELALINLAVNARDAMPSGGRLGIAVSAVELRGEPDGLVGPFLAISVADTGTGIPADVLPRVFNPFFTTKESGKGTGLGLSQVYGFARQSGGTATVESAPGRGATVTIYLPRSKPVPAAAVRAETVVGAMGRGRRALLVEDNGEVADVTRRYLEELGFAVHTAGNAREALRLSAEVGPDLVLSDVVMPGPMNGLELARRLRSRDPDLAIVLATGYSASAKEAIDDGFSVLSKPYNIARLNAVLDAALERASSERRRGAAPAST